MTIKVKKEITYKESNKLICEGNYLGYNFYIYFGFCPLAYIEIPLNHKYYYVDYDEISIYCHGGLTYSDDELGIDSSKNNSWFIGWDYGHINDYIKLPKSPIFIEKNSKDKKWTTDEILEEIKNVIEQLKSQE